MTPEDSHYPGCAIIAAINRTDMKALEMFLDRGAQPDVVNGCFTSPLMAAVYQGNEVFVNLLLKKGADVNLCVVPNLNLEEDTGCITALEAAALNGYVNMIQLLVRHGAFLTHSREGTAFKTVLQCAAYYGEEEALKALLELGSDPNIIGGFSVPLFRLPLQLAAKIVLRFFSAPAQILMNTTLARYLCFLSIMYDKHQLTSCSTGLQ